MRDPVVPAEEAAQDRHLVTVQYHLRVTEALSVECQRLRESLENAEEYAKEGWDWLDKALKALGVETVFDIPDTPASEQIDSCEEKP